MKKILEALRREDLISLEQYEKLMVDDAAFDPRTTVMIIKDTEVGRGLKFLPRKLTDLKNKIQSAINEENITLKDILVYLDEMFRKNGISVNDYQSIKKETIKKMMLIMLRQVLKVNVRLMIMRLKI